MSRAPAREARAVRDRNEATQVKAAFSKARCLSRRRRSKDDLPHISEHKVRKHLKDQGLAGYQRESPKGCTKADRSHLKSPDLLERNFTADTPNQVWVSDVTEFQTTEGVGYACVITDVFARRIIAAVTGRRNDADLVIAAVDQAVKRRGITSNSSEVILHSDQGSNYTSNKLKEHINVLDVIKLSNGSTGDCYDNVLAESIFATIKEEGYRQTRIHDFDTMNKELNEYIHWHNTSRRHSYNNNQPPAQAELHYQTKHTA